MFIIIEGLLLLVLNVLFEIHQSVTLAVFYLEIHHPVTLAVFYLEIHRSVTLAVFYLEIHFIF